LRAKQVAIGIQTPVSSAVLRNEDPLRCPADDRSCGGIESASNDTPDKRNTLNKVHRASGASFRNQPKADSLIYTPEKLAGYPEDHLPCHLGPNIDSDVLQDIEPGRTRKTRDHQRFDLIAPDIIAPQVCYGPDHADLYVQHAGATLDGPPPVG
jgi:hypothetical protein